MADKHSMAELTDEAAATREEPADLKSLSGPWQIAAIMTVAGLLVGVIRRYTNADEANVFAAVVKWRLEPKPVPPSLLVSLVSLVGGFSLGPDAIRHVGRRTGNLAVRTPQDV